MVAPTPVKKSRVISNGGGCDWSWHGIVFVTVSIIWEKAQKSISSERWLTLWTNLVLKIVLHNCGVLFACKWVESDWVVYWKWEGKWLRYSYFFLDFLHWYEFGPVSPYSNEFQGFNFLPHQIFKPKNIEDNRLNSLSILSMRPRQAIVSWKI